PETVELAHEDFAQILADHGRQGNAKRRHVRSRRDGNGDLATQADDLVPAAVGALFAREHETVFKGMLQYGAVVVAAAIFIDRYRERLISVKPHAMTEQVGQSQRQNRAFAAPFVYQTVKLLRRHQGPGGQPPLQASTMRDCFPTSSITRLAVPV